MSISDAEKWNLRYQHKTTPNPPAAVLTENQHLLSASGNALELACGLGGNSLFLAERGYTVTSLDVSEVAINRLTTVVNQSMFHVKPCVQDLLIWQPPKAIYDLIVISAYYQRSLFEKIKFALKPNGLIFYQTFTREKAIESGPTNPDFLLAKGELLTHFSEFELIRYCENSVIGDLNAGLRNQAYIVARKPTQD